MKITHNKVGRNVNLTDTAKSEKSGKADKVGESSGKASSISSAKESDPTASKVELSSRAQDLKRIKDVAMAAPDVDEAKVAKYQKLIDEGKYKVDAEAVADKMVDDHLLFS